MCFEQKLDIIILLFSLQKLFRFLFIVFPLPFNLIFMLLPLPLLPLPILLPLLLELLHKLFDSPNQPTLLPFLPESAILRAFRTR